LPEQIFLLRPGANMLCPRGDLLLSGASVCLADGARGASGRLCAPPGPHDQYE
jgi:hypothetical protein